MATPFTRPPHNPYRNDPDETEGRRLYRGLANAEARMSLGLMRAKRIKLDAHPGDFNEQR